MARAASAWSPRNRGTYTEIDLYAYKGRFSYQSTYHVFYLDPQVAGVKAKNNFLCLCNAYKYGGSYSRLADGEIGYIFQDHIAIRDDSFEGNVSDFGNSLEGVVCVLELASPILITTLTPQQINAIKGQTNTIWSDANGDCEVTYLKKGWLCGSLGMAFGCFCGWLVCKTGRKTKK